MKLEFVNEKPHKHSLHSSNFNKEETEVIHAEIKKLLDKKVITKSNAQGSFISSVFTRPKKDGSKRMILNLKTFLKIKLVLI